MNLTSDDPKVRTAAVTNLTVEAVTMVLSLALMTYALCGATLTEKISLKMKRWRNQFFGPPPMSEEEIQRHAHLLHIEASRILREAKS